MGSIKLIQIPYFHKKAVFLIQNIFPVTEKYIAEKYINSNIDVEIPEIVRNEIITTALRVVRLAEEGINVPFYNIIEMKNILLEDTAKHFSKKIK